MNIFKALNRGRGKATLPGKTGYCYRSAEDFHFYWSGFRNRKSSTHDLERDDWDAFQQYPAEDQMVLDEIDVCDKQAKHTGFKTNG